jgi:hypothetical protein
MYVSGTIDGDYLIVARVHRRSQPPGAVRVLEYAPLGAKHRLPRAGDRLRYCPGGGAVAGGLGTVPAYVYAPERAKPGANAKGKGLRLYLPVEVAEPLRAIATSEGKTPAEVVAGLVQAQPHIGLRETLQAIQAQHPTCPVGIYYHPDADPGDGSGWCLEVGDTRSYGSLVDVIVEAVFAGEVPHE